MGAPRKAEREGDSNPRYGLTPYTAFPDLRSRRRGQAYGAFRIRSSPRLGTERQARAPALGLALGYESLPTTMLAATADRPGAVLFGALGAVAVNNLPAASLLSSHPLAHPFFLLPGLN